jgi:hypothetical protein
VSHALHFTERTPKKGLDGDRAREAHGGAGSSKMRDRPANPNLPERGDIFYFLLILIFWYEYAFEITG